MKQIFTFAFIAVAWTSWSQSIETIGWPGTVQVPADEPQYEVALDVQNVGASTVSIRVSSHVQYIVPGTDYRFCWGPTCYNWITDDFTSPDNDALIVTMAPGEVNSSFYTDYRHFDNEGTSTIDYCWFDTNNPSDESCFTLNWTLGAVGVEEITRADIASISPNPVTGTSSIAYQITGAHQRAKVQIYSMVGTLVQEISLNNPLGLLMIHADDFRSGIYMVNITVDGRTFSTKRMIVS